MVGKLQFELSRVEFSSSLESCSVVIFGLASTNICVTVHDLQLRFLSTVLEAMAAAPRILLLSQGSLL